MATSLLSPPSGSSLVPNFDGTGAGLPAGATSFDPSSLMGGSGSNPLSSFGMSGGTGGTNPFSSLSSGLPGMSGSGGDSNPLSSLMGGMGGSGGSGGMGGFNPMASLGLGGGSDIYGSKPIVPNYPTADAITKATIGTALDNYDAASTLTNKINKSNQDQLTATLRNVIPGYDAIVAKTSSNIQDQLNGVIPKDVASAMNQSNASWQVANGQVGSGMGADRGLRNFGLTSLQRMDAGVKSAQSWIQTARQLMTPGLIGIQDSFLSKEQMLGLADKTFQRDVYAAQVAAAPDPVARGRFDTQQALIGEVLSIYSGGAGWKGIQSQTPGMNPAGQPPAGGVAQPSWVPDYGGNYAPTYSNTAGPTGYASGGFQDQGSSIPDYGGGLDGGGGDGAGLAAMFA